MLSGEELLPGETEAYQAVAIHEWALQPLLKDSSVHTLLLKLAEKALSIHGDRWLKDFILSPQTPRADKLLLEAIDLNHSGEADSAVKRAAQAEKDFELLGNQAGALRSRFEKIYALRRLSRSDDCLRSEPAQEGLKAHEYPWVEAQTAMELASCDVMKGRPDRSRALNRSALDTATRAKYGNLLLRALSLAGNLDLHDGRSGALWSEDQSGLALFRGGAYPDERGFQLFHDLEQDSQGGGYVYAALLLQREALARIAGQGRFDFEAMAHLRMAEAAGRLGNLDEERNELASYQIVLDRLPRGSDARHLYQAYCDIGLARLAIHSGDTAQAIGFLETAKRALDGRGNAWLKLEYLSTASELARAQGDAPTEQRYLEAVLAIGNRQSRILKSASDRWYWQRLMDRSQRRWLELRLNEPHLPEQTFGVWHLARMLDGAEADFAAPEDWARNQLRSWQDTKLLSFAILPHATVAWVASAKGVDEIVLPVPTDVLLRETRLFYRLCSDGESNIKEVNASGSRLFQMLILPLEKELGETQRIVISTDSFLSFIPWAALQTGSGEYWGLTRDIAVHTGFTSRGINGRKREDIKRIVVATPGAVTADGVTYLPMAQAEDEARYVSAFSPQTRRLAPGKSSAGRLLAELANAEALHFAGHAVTRGEGGELIVDEADGSAILSAAVLRNTRMAKLRLVVLSACSTASPETVAEQNPDGLVKAFVLAGAQVVVASRWDVDSGSTAELMKSFYRELKRGGSAAEALARARQNLMSEKKFQHPYYWSAFQVFTPN